jgi:hypothetical protein
MTQKRIKELANFFYSSDESEEVPLRIAAVTGQYSGFDFDKNGCIKLLTIMNKSTNLKKDLELFCQEYGK